MKIFEKIVKYAKKAIKFIADFFKGKNPVQVINDTVTTVVTVATAAVAVYAGINAIRVHLIPSIKKNRDSNVKSGVDYFFEDRKVGSVDDKITNLKNSTSKINKRGVGSLSKIEMKALKEISSGRNSFFQSLSPEEQMSVLEMEEFDFKKYVEDTKERSKRPLFHWGKRIKKFGVSPTDKPFREPADYGFFNFILRPLDNFIHWIKNDPVPLKVKQIRLVDHPEIPNIPCETAHDVIAAAKSLDSYLSNNNQVVNETVVSSPNNLEQQQILADEIFRYGSITKFKKAVSRRMAQSDFNLPNIFDLIDDEKDDGKKKKKKKKKFHDEDDFSSNSKKKMSKEEKAAMSEADKRAQETYEYHLKVAMSGSQSFKGRKFEI